LKKQSNEKVDFLEKEEIRSLVFDFQELDKIRKYECFDSFDLKRGLN
jgi:hypothetical protein